MLFYFTYEWNVCTIEHIDLTKYKSTGQTNSSGWVMWSGCRTTWSFRWAEMLKLRINMILCMYTREAQPNHQYWWRLIMLNHKIPSDYNFIILFQFAYNAGFSNKLVLFEDSTSSIISFQFSRTKIPKRNPKHYHT